MILHEAGHPGLQTPQFPEVRGSKGRRRSGDLAPYDISSELCWVWGPNGDFTEAKFADEKI